MTIKRRDFQKAAALIHELQLKLSEDVECAELRDALNLSLLHMQRYYRKLRTRLQQNQEKQFTNGNHVLSQSLRGLSPMTPFRDTPDKFLWKWLNLESAKLTSTLPADLNKEFSTLPLVIQASKQGDNDMLMQHIERDPDCIFEVDGIGRNALMYAVNFGHLDTIQILLENGIEVSAVAHDGSTAIHRACHDGNHEALQILVEYEANLNIQDTQGRYPIHWACAHPRRDCLKLLLDKQVDTSVKDHDGLTPCMWACRMDNIDHFELLAPSLDTEEGDGFERDLSGRTWMHWSVRRTDPLECLKTLLTEESANLKDEDGKTVVHCASETGSLSAVKIVLEIAGKSVLEHRDGNDRTPLILATMGGHGEIVNFLLSEGADLACVDQNGATAWDYACNRQLHYCMLILASYIRQRAKDEAQGKDLPNGRDLSNGLITEDTLGLNHLQINGGDTPMLYGHKPIPPPHPPNEGMTPRTPRTPRQATSRGVFTPRGHNYGAQNSSYPEPSPNEGPRVQGGVKRSTSTNGSIEEEAFFERNKHKPSSASHKRVKSEQSPDREALMSVMSIESPERTHSDVSRPYTPANQGADEEPQIPNDSQYVEGADDEDNSRVSIDAMDVSDFDGDPDATDGDDEQEADAENSPTRGGYTAQNHGYHSQHQADPSPQPPPKPHPRHQAPFSYAPPKNSLSQPAFNHQGAAPAGTHQKFKGQKSNPHYSRGRPPGGHTVTGGGDYDDSLDPEDTDQINGEVPYQESGPSHVTYPSADPEFDLDADVSEGTKNLLLGDLPDSKHQKTGRKNLCPRPTKLSYPPSSIDEKHNTLKSGPIWPEVKSEEVSQLTGSASAVVGNIPKVTSSKLDHLLSNNEGRLHVSLTNLNNEQNRNALKVTRAADGMSGNLGSTQPSEGLLPQSRTPQEMFQRPRTATCVLAPIPRGPPPSDHRVPPPAHLSPLQSGAMPAPKKKKKKKKKELQSMANTEDYGASSRSYVAPIPPPLHPNHPPPPTPQPRERSPPRGVGVGGGLMNDRGAGLSNTLHGNVRPNSGALSKPTPKKRSAGPGSDREQRFQGLNTSNRIGFTLDSQMKVTKSSHNKLPSAPRLGSGKSLDSSLPHAEPTSSRVPSLPKANSRFSQSPQPKPRKSDSRPVTPVNRRSSHPDHNEQGSDGDYEERGQRSRSFRQGQGQGQTRPGSGKKMQQPLVQNGGVSNGIHGQPGLMAQNVATHKRPPSGNRRDASPAPREKHPPSPRSRRPPSGSLGALGQQNPPWSKKQLPNGRLPPSYGLQ